MAIEAHGNLLRRNWALPLALLALGVVAVCGMAETTPATAGIGAFCGVLSACCIPFALLIAARNAFPRASPRTLSATSDGVVVAGELPIPSADVLEAKLVSRGTDAVLELTIRGRGALRFRAAAADARALLATIGRRRARFRLIAGFAARYLFSVVAISLFYVAKSLVAPPEALVDLAFSFPSSIFSGFCFGSFLGFPLAVLLGLVSGSLTIGAEGLTRAGSASVDSFLSATSRRSTAPSAG